MAEDSVGEIALDITVNFENIKASVNAAAKDISSKFKNAFSRAKNDAEKDAKSISDSVKKAGNESEEAVSESEKKIKEILADSERAMKSKASGIAGIYRKQGMNASDAMKKAWEQIERNSSDSNDSMRKDSKKTSDSIKKHANEMSSAFSGVNGSLNGIGSIAKKLAVLLAGSFVVKGIVDFGKKCLELGSDLEEVQNVVDVAFPTMSDQIDKFAKNAAFSFGLSETMAKRFSGTFGSMAETFGFTEKESAKMATTLTGLAGDVASFYNISQDEAYTKLKSVFSGETETLKDLGIVMTQAALDAYALANGFGKTTAKMSEMEKVSLRYAFVQDKLKNATGDFARTSDSWANQVRILSLQFDSLRANIGQGLINVFSPVIKLINSLMGRLVTLASAFKSFTELITGKKSEDAGAAKSASAAAEALGNASSNAEDLKKETKAAGKEAKKTAKEMLGIAGFDELNPFNSSKDDSGKDKDKEPSSGGGSVGGKIDFGTPAQGENEALKKLDGALKGILDLAKKASSLFAKGFKIGLGDLSVLDSIKKELKSIQKSIGEIFSDKKLQAAIKNWAASLILNFGKVAGSVASVGLTIADNLLGGISKYLQQHKKDIIEDLTALFNISADTMNIVGNFSAVLAEIATVFRSDEAKQITADLINIFADSVLNFALLGQKLANSLISNITKPIIENKDKIKKALENTIRPLSTVINSISTFVSDTWDKVQAIYDQHVAPLFDSIGDGVSGWMGTFLDGYNQYIAPVLTQISEKFKAVMEGHIQPAVNAVLGVFGDFCDVLKTLWEKRIQPMGNWIIKNLVPIFAVKLKGAVDKVMVVVRGFADLIKNIATGFSGVCKAIKAIINGDWKSAWEGAKAALSSAVEGFKIIFKTGWEFIKKVFAPVGSFFKGVWSTIKAAFSLAAGWFDNTFKGAYRKVTGAFSGVKSAFSGVWSAIKKPFISAASWFDSTFKGAYKKVTGAFSGAKSAFTSVWSAIKKPFANVADWFKDKFSAAWEAVKKVFSAGGKVFSGIKEGIADTFKKVVNSLIGGINVIVKKPFEAINGMLNKIRDVGVMGVKPFKGLWGKNPLTVPKIPALANGGYVKANTPRLAMIGDNRHYGEIVSPENKLQAMADDAASKAGQATAKALIPVIERLCNSIIELENSQGNTARLEGVSESGLYRLVKSEHEKEKKRKGGAGYVL